MSRPMRKGISLPDHKLPLECELQPKLDQTGITHRGIDHSERIAAHRSVGRPKLRTIEQIEELGAEFKVHSLRRTESCLL